MNVDYWMLNYDVITNPRWRMATNVKKLCQAVISVKEMIRLSLVKFSTLNRIGTVINMI